MLDICIRRDLHKPVTTESTDVLCYSSSLPLGNHAPSRCRVPFFSGTNFDCRHKEMLDATSMSFHRRLSSCECSFIRNMVAFVPPSILPSHRKQFSFLQLKSTKLALSKQRCKRFLKVVFAAKLTKATKKCKGASVYRSVPQDF